MTSNTQFDCKRCGFTTPYRYCLERHLTKKRLCKPFLSNEEGIVEAQWDEMVKETKAKKTIPCKTCGKCFSHRSSMYRHRATCVVDTNSIASQIHDIQEDTQEIKRLTHIVTNNLKLAKVSKDENNEVIYQQLLEKYRFPGATHKRVACGVTDITTDTLHAEIKRFDCWKEAIGQLMAYKVVMHRSELQVYLFGKCSQACKDMAIHVFQALNIHPFEMILTDTDFIVVDLLNRTEQKFDLELC